MGKLYTAFSAENSSPLSALPIQYADFANRQRGWFGEDGLDHHLAYWKGQLEGAPSESGLMTDRIRPPTHTYCGASETLLLPKSLGDSLKAMSQREGTTLFMTLLAAFQTLLRRYTDRTDIIVGCPIAGRDRVETEELIGVFVNTLVMRTDFSGNPTFRELLGRVREVALEAYAHRNLPFEKLVEALHPARDLSRNPLFQVMFQLRNLPRKPFEIKGLKIDPLPSPSRGKFLLLI